MTKQDLRTGMVIETRESRRYIVLKETNLCANGNGYFTLDSLNDDLKCSSFPELDVIKVYANGYYNLTHLLKGCTTLIWERKEAKELTVAEIEKLLGYPVKIVKE